MQRSAFQKLLNTMVPNIWRLVGQFLTRGSQAHWVTVDPLSPALLTLGACGLCCGGSPVLCRVLSSIPGFQALDASRNPGASTEMCLSACVCVRSVFFYHCLLLIFKCLKMSFKTVFLCGVGSTSFFHKVPKCWQAIHKVNTGQWYRTPQIHWISGS